MTLEQIQAVCRGIAPAVREFVANGLRERDEKIATQAAELVEVRRRLAALEDERK